MTDKIIEIGDTVLCDSCNEDYTNSEESGGVLFGTYAHCPTCAPRIRKLADESGETEYIKAECPEGMSFKEWVLQLRGGDNTIRIQSF